MALLFLVFASVLYVGWYKLERTPPQVTFQTLPEVWGRKATLKLEVADSRSGLRSIEIFLQAQGVTHLIFTEEYPPGGWRENTVKKKALQLTVSLDPAKVSEGPATVQVFAEDYSWTSLFGQHHPRVVREVRVDLTPPVLEVLSSQHYVRLGGSEILVYRTSDDVVRSGVEVEGYFFPGTAGLFPEAATYVALFAIPQDLSERVHPRAVAIDAAGNRRETGFFCSIKSQDFPQRSLEISDAFLERKVPEIAAVNRLGDFPDLLKGYIHINRVLRQQTEEELRRRCRTSVPTPLWEGPLLQQKGSKVMSRFADKRIYLHHGQEIDTQTHLGYDLASLRHNPVVAANTGKIVLAENLGIYGNCIIIDHGLGLFSLYGHLSSIGVQEDQMVKKGEVIGRTGDTGLAGGDHLHFSTMLYGVHVDPVEWWDSKWLQDHVQTKLPPPSDSALAGLE